MGKSDNKVLLAALLAAKRAQDKPNVEDLRHEQESNFERQGQSIERLRAEFQAYQAHEESREERLDHRQNAITESIQSWFSDNRELFKGEKGEKGEAITGPRGPKGERGESIVGPVGPMGPKGEKGDKGDSIVGPRGPKGERGESIIGRQGEKGEKGDIGPMPKHQWDGTKLRFEQKPGVWGRYVDLQGPQGVPGKGRRGFSAPATQQTGGGGGEARQEVFVGQEPVGITYPALAFVATEVDGQTVYQMRVNA